MQTIQNHVHTVVSHAGENFAGSVIQKINVTRYQSGKDASNAD